MSNEVIINKQLVGQKIGKQICDDDEDIISDGEYDIGIICEIIDEEILNDIRIDIQMYVEEYLNKYYER